MQFKVPQFLEVEDKIFGPFTFREFVYLAGGAGLCYVLFKVLGLFLGAIPILVVAGLSLALTFYRPNGKPFVYMLESAIKYFAQGKLYIWQRRVDEKGHGVGNTKDSMQIKKEILKEEGIKLSGSKLRDLAWSLDVLDLKK